VDSFGGYMIKTTVNFLKSRLDRVIDVANESGIGYKKLIKMCLERFLNDFEKGNFAERALLYQPDADKWQKVHFKFTFSEYDTYFDCKKVIRWSFSLIVAVAIDTYLDSVFNEDQDDSYHTDTYSKLYILVGKYPIYLFSWAKNEKIEKIKEILRE
jgi:hypothetical protein